MAFLDRGREVLNKVILEVEELGKVESEPRMEGSYMRIMIAPLPPEVIAKAKSVKAVLAEEASAAETAIKEENTDTNTETEA
jgi:translation initiation factor IF-3